MILSYLEKLQEQYIEEKRTIDRECEHLQLSLKENIEFIKLLEESNDPNYESFTPREVNGKNKAKISELLEQQKEIQSNLEQKEMYRDACDKKIEELYEILAATKKLQEENQTRDLELNTYRTSLSEMQEQEKKSQQTLEELQGLIVQKLTDQIRRIELCSKLVELDIVRCRLELDTMSTTIYEMIDDVRKITGNSENTFFEEE